MLRCLFCSRIYLKLQEKSSFLALLLFFVVWHPFRSLTPAGVAVCGRRISSAYSGTASLARAAAAFWQCQCSLTSATWRTRCANSLKAELSLNMKYLNSYGFLPPGKKVLAAFILERWSSTLSCLFFFFFPPKFVQVVRLKKLARTLAIWALVFYRVGCLKAYLFAKHFTVLGCNSLLMCTYVIASN